MDILVPETLNQDRMDRIRLVNPDGDIYSFDIPFTIKALRYISRRFFPYPIYLLGKKIFESDSIKLHINGRPIRYVNNDIQIMYSPARIRKPWFQNTLPFLPNLKWVHSMSTGVDHLMRKELIDKNIILTNAGPVYSREVAEFILSLIFVLSKKLNSHILYQSKKRYKDLTSRKLDGKTVGIIGLGNIGKKLAQMATPMGLKIIAIRRNPEKESVPFPVWTLERLDDLLKLSDFVIVCLPLTDKTRDLIGERELKLMKETAYLINVARGALVDETALITSLKNGVIAGAALDVTRELRVPRFSPLYSVPNLILTPHVSFTGEMASDNNFDIFLDNLVRFKEGKPLLNCIDLKKMY